MAKFKEKNIHFWNESGCIEWHAWMAHLREIKPDIDFNLLHQACLLCDLISDNEATHDENHLENHLQRGLSIAEILTDLEVFDPHTLAAAIIYPCAEAGDLAIEDISAHLGSTVSTLVEGVLRMDSLGHVHRQIFNAPRTGSFSDNLRKMLIAMVDNIQVVLIKLSERIHSLRENKTLPPDIQKLIAQETLEIYAPLANRLGIGQIKSELEDLSFRSIEPEQYKIIARALNERRVDRDRYVHLIVDLLENALISVGIKNSKVYGRAKHIYSIHKKMQRKNVDINEIYDATAVRVLVDTIEDCYKVLSVVHEKWERIPEEFDDYIAHPKENGYRSLHTAVIGPEGKHFEVQIRTYDIHQEAELGVAAHWVYKEGGLQPQAGHERKIAWLRQVLDWQKEITQHSSDTTLQKNIQEDLEDRIYVFTPAGDIVDLPKKSTPLDFAYHIHSGVGHRCRGATVDGAIVPLTYQLKTGEQVSILTTKQPKPSRDWLNVHLGYVHTSKAKAKILQWFKQQDYEKHRQEGNQSLEKELKKQEIPLHLVNYEKLASQLHFKNSMDLFAAVGRGDLKTSHIISVVQSTLNLTPESNKQNDLEEIVSRKTKALNSLKRKSEKTDFIVQGVDNLLSRTAQCCKPIPGDPIIGYITQGQGIKVHRSDCKNILDLDATRQERLIHVNWRNSGTKLLYPVDILITANDRNGLIRDISTIVSAEKINVLATNTRSIASQNRAYMTFTLSIDNLNLLQRTMQLIQNMPDVISVERVQ